MYVVNDSYFEVEEHRNRLVGRIMLEGEVKIPCSIPLAM